MEELVESHDEVAQRCIIYLLYYDFFFFFFLVYGQLELAN